MPGDAARRGLVVRSGGAAIGQTEPIDAGAPGGNGQNGGAREPARAGPKIGRNDPCWCGSGKKYKKCHGA